MGGSERPCHGNGNCDGDGTRGGDGQCSCDHAYKGEFCLDCIDGYFNEVRNDTFSLCTGTVHHTKHEHAAISALWYDLNKGKNMSLTSDVNLNLSVTPSECHSSCKTCTGATSQDCDECKDGWEEDDQEACVGKKHKNKVINLQMMSFIVCFAAAFENQSLVDVFRTVGTINIKLFIAEL